jgi:hypothetical protein
MDKKNNKDAQANTDFEVRNFSVNLIKNSAIKTLLDLNYNESALKQLLLQIEGQLESYHLMRLSVLRDAAAKKNEGVAQNISESALSVSPDLLKDGIL